MISIGKYHRFLNFIFVILIMRGCVYVHVNAVAHGEQRHWIPWSWIEPEMEPLEDQESL